MTRGKSLEASFFLPRVVETSRSKPFFLQPRIALPAVSVLGAPRINTIDDERVQAVGRGIRDHPNADSSDYWPISLSRDDTQGFIGLLPTSHSAFRQPADECLVNLDPATQSVPVRSSGWSHTR